MSAPPAPRPDGPAESERPRLLPAGGVVAGVLALVAVVCGLIGVDQQLDQYPHARHDTWEICFRVLQLFALEWDEPDGSLAVPRLLQVARFLAPAVTLYAAFEAGRRLFSEELRQRWIRRRRGHVIVCGSGSGARSLALSLTASGERVVVVGNEPGGRTAGRGAAQHVTGDPRFSATLTAAGLAGAKALYACDEDSTRNLAVALAASGTLAAGGPSIHAEIRDPALCRALQARWWSGDGARRVRLDFFNRYQAAATRLAREEAARLPDDGAREILVAGEGAFPAAFVTGLGRLGPDPSRLVVTWVGPGADEAVREISAVHPFLGDARVLRSSGATLPDAVREAVARGAAARVYLCSPDPEQVIRQALLDTDLWRAGPESVTVCADDIIGYGQAFRPPGTAAASLDGMGGRLRLWSIKASAYRQDAIGEDLTEIMARAVHEAYLRQRARERAAGREPTGTLVPWSDLPEDLRNANRSQVISFGQKLAELDCVLMPRDGRAASLVLPPEIVESLAEAEHRRWMDDRRAAGWTYAAVRDDVARHHPDLVPWSELADADREKDREVIRGMGAILADVGFDVVSAAGSRSGTGIPRPRR
ncbi:RyR domain-containing protein [Streptomyces sp. JHA26]|uniref:RyR domain-containing protein n=1 Tax=Streptomyces sp. JHA26 TaxID=1917143 RepID=UPI00098BC302|nr:RyR domain-containing protein [Streptomyces sp. JHA26]